MIPNIIFWFGIGSAVAAMGTNSIPSAIISTGLMIAGAILIHANKIIEAKP